MKFKEFIQEIQSGKLIEDITDVNIELDNNEQLPPKTHEKDDEYYYNIINPSTGLRYDIPLLSTIDPGYRWSYIYYMKLKEQSPETFEKLIRWE